jgi:hypothetical protein
MIGNNFTDNSGIANPVATHFLHKVLRLLPGQTEKQPSCGLRIKKNI